MQSKIYYYWAIVSRCLRCCMSLHYGDQTTDKNKCITILINTQNSYLYTYFYTLCSSNKCLALMGFNLNPTRSLDILISCYWAWSLSLFQCSFMFMISLFQSQDASLATVEFCKSQVAKSSSQLCNSLFIFFLDSCFLIIGDNHPI